MSFLFKSVNNSQNYKKFGTALSSRIGKTGASFLSFYISLGSATRFLRDGEKYYTYFVDSLLLFPMVKKNSKSVNI